MNALALAAVAAYAALNGLGAVQSRAARAPSAIFALAAAALAAGAAADQTELVAAGLVLASAAPILYGWRVRGRIRLSHHAVRALVALALLGLWLAA